MVCLLGMLMALTVCPLNAQEFRIVPVNIYGDGDPLNGIEDSRVQVRKVGEEKEGFSDQQMSAGTITCDGKFLGVSGYIPSTHIQLDPRMDLSGIVD